MSKWVATAGSQPIAVQTAQEYLDAGGSAVGAVLAGFFADAGTHAGVLFGPLVIIVAGVGNGARVFDGRLRQPGLGAKRPRGFTQDDSIPIGARFAVPHAVSAAAVAHSYDRTGPFADLVRRGIRQARQAGANSRVNVLEKVQSLGGRYLSDAVVARPLLHVAGASEGGLLTQADLVSVPNLDSAATSHTELGEWFVVPWSDGESETTCTAVNGNTLRTEQTAASDAEPSSRSNVTHLLLAVDARGIFAGASYQHTLSGVEIAELQLVAPKAAIPVRRGVPRLTPGSGLPAPSPIAVRLLQGIAVSMVGDPSRRSMCAHAVLNPKVSIHRHPITRQTSTNERCHALDDLVNHPSD